jgi:hypothetical protein
MAYISRSDKQLLVKSGIFSNPIINAWSILAVGFLASAVYYPVLSRQFNLTFIPIAQLLLIAFVVMFIVSLLELRKLVKRA